MVYYVSNSELYHFGIKGQKWGIRRYQNEDGTYTELGKERYSDSRMYKRKGGTMKKGTIVSRVLVNNPDDVTYGNKNMFLTRRKTMKNGKTYLKIIMNMERQLLCINYLMT